MSPAGSWYVITAGSKEVLMAWNLSFEPSSCSSAGVSLQHQWLATRPPPRTGLRPQSRKQGASMAATEHRYLTLAVLPILAGCLHIVAASSSATVQLLRLDLMTKRSGSLARPPFCDECEVIKSMVLPDDCSQRMLHAICMACACPASGQSLLWLHG